VVVNEVEPCKSSQQFCTEFVVRSATNVALNEAVETICGMVHCTPLTQAFLLLVLHYSSRVEKRQSSSVFVNQRTNIRQTVYTVLALVHNISHMFIKSQLAINGNSKYVN